MESSQLSVSKFEHTYINSIMAIIQNKDKEKIAASRLHDVLFLFVFSYLVIA